jgi:hypothetical protein
MMQHHEVHALGPRKIIVWITRAISYLIYFYLIAVEIILFIGFFLLLFGANPTAGFTEWAYRNLDRVMEPFRGIFTPIQLGTTSGNVESVFETSVLFAMIIYGIIAIVLSALISWLSGRLRYLEAAEAEAELRAAEEAQAAAQAAAARATAVPTSPTVTSPTVTATATRTVSVDPITVEPISPPPVSPPPVIPPPVNPPQT